MKPQSFSAFPVYFVVVLVLMAGATMVTSSGGAQNATAIGSTSSFSADCDPDALPPPQDEQCRTTRRLEGRRLFDEETFGGNGRTCETCHSKKNGTFSPADVRARLRKPNDPLFAHDGLDDGFSGTSRIEEHATVRVTLPLPPHLTLPYEPGVTELTFHRGTPSTLNTPALDPALMYDFRDENLEVQALGAIRGHAQNAFEPTQLQLELIAEFQRSDPRFFSDGRLKQFARTGVPPALPEGETESEKRGRLFFIDAPFQPPSKVGVCALCHSGPMLNEANAFAVAVFRTPPGARIHTVGVSERNLLGNPVHTFLVHDGFGEPVPVTTPDIGILMSDPAKSPAAGRALPPLPLLPRLGVRLAFFANRFKTPSLWGVKHTAPYFHDNSAKDLGQMLEQYDWFFENMTIDGAIQLTPQDKEDMKAFLNLL